MSRRLAPSGPTSVASRASPHRWEAPCAAHRAYLAGLVSIRHWCCVRRSTHLRTLARVSRFPTVSRLYRGACPAGGVRVHGTQCTYTYISIARARRTPRVGLSRGSSLETRGVCCKQWQTKAEHSGSLGFPLRTAPGCETRAGGAARATKGRTRKGSLGPAATMKALCGRMCSSQGREKGLLEFEWFGDGAHAAGNLLCSSLILGPHASQEPRDAPEDELSPSGHHLSSSPLSELLDAIQTHISPRFKEGSRYDCVPVRIRIPASK